MQHVRLDIPCSCRIACEDAKEPYFYLAQFDEPLVIYDYVTGLPVSEARPNNPTPPEPSMACPGESEPSNCQIVGRNFIAGEPRTGFAQSSRHHD